VRSLDETLDVIEREGFMSTMQNRVMPQLLSILVVQVEPLQVVIVGTRVVSDTTDTGIDTSIAIATDTLLILIPGIDTLTDTFCLRLK
jgi:hypothetical protein